MTVTNAAVQPKVSIDGKQKVSKYRSSSISLFAIASVPVCEGADAPEGLTFTWKVYVGSQYVSSIQSISRDPRYFKILPYTLEIDTVYSVYVEVEVEGAPASKHVSVEVLSEGVQASILGGSKRKGMRWTLIP